jgi:hypothetical protein
MGECKGLKLVAICGSVGVFVDTARILYTTVEVDPSEARR